jgi:hypothetical protein
MRSVSAHAVGDKLEGLPHAIFGHFLLGFMQLLELLHQNFEHLTAKLVLLAELPPVHKNDLLVQSRVFY